MFLPSEISPFEVEGPSAMISPFLTFSPIETMGFWLIQVDWLERRNLIKVNISDALLAEKRVSVLMGDIVEPRKEWINENVEFSLEDDYKI